MTDAQVGRPFRFLLLVLLCWSTGRIAATFDWRRSFATAQTTRVEGSIVAGRFSTTVSPNEAPPTHRPILHATSGTSHRFAPVAIAARSPSPSLVGALAYTNPAKTPLSAHDAPEPAPPAFALTTPVQTAPPLHRWSAGAWMLWRGAARRDSVASVGQLGGSQAGVRLDFDLAPDRQTRVALYTRLTAALERPHAPEAAAGIAFQPSRTVPVSIGIERRIALDDDARDAFAIVASGGVNPVALPGHFMLEGYAQAGVVGMRRKDGFADGKLSALRPFGHPQISLGASLSGGAQPQVARLDIGPELRVRVPIGTRAARISAEWRERVAGNARPGSGLAVTLAADF